MPDNPFAVIGMLCNSFFTFSQAVKEFLNAGIQIGDINISAWGLITGATGVILILIITGWLLEKVVH